MADLDMGMTQEEWKVQEDADAAALANLLAEAQTGGGESHAEMFDHQREFDQTDKNEDAIDFEDISDDDLIDEEEEPATGPSGDNPGLTDDQGSSHGVDDLDDLFGPASPENIHGQDESVIVAEPEPQEEEDLRAINFPEYHHSANQDPNIPAPAESNEEFVKQAYPGFELGIILDFSKFVGPKPSRYLAKKPLKVPRSLAPTKISLELGPDQEKSFRTAGTAQIAKQKRAAEAEARGLVLIEEESDENMSDDEGFDYSIPGPDDQIGGFTWGDLEAICADWDGIEKRAAELPTAAAVDGADEEDDEWFQNTFGQDRPVKRRKVNHVTADFFNTPRFAIPSFDNYEEDTARIAKRVLLDENDPNILLDISEYSHVDKKQRTATGAVKRRAIKSRFNYSNDDAYDALKENHSNKVRATLGNVTVEHSMPAVRLQWPYYRTKLSKTDTRAYHRPSLKFPPSYVNRDITFAKPNVTKKRKNMTHLAAQEAFKFCADLTLADHYSTATLFEYSEEHPTVLSNFGMGNRVINYYRRKEAEDTERPVFEDKVGELTVLLPEDQSPFSKFGMVDPGETVRSIHNAMYRAPIYKHDIKDTDFLIIRNSTGVNGSEFFIRLIDNMFVVGQQFPLTEIPSPQSRKHTNAAKNRLRMFAFRKIRHSDKGQLKVADVTKHVQGSTDLQNRQKLKEFLSYNKEIKSWFMRGKDVVPEESIVRAMISPEEICSIDAMQVGEQHLIDSGYEVGKDDYNEDNDDKKKSKTIEQRLVPWDTTRAFLDASSGKAMLMLHGEGDPTGCGLGISMVKISMKGGYQGDIKGPNATSGAAMSAAEKKANGGHTYNVKKQEEAYSAAIRTIWEKQKQNLTNPIEIEQNELEREQLYEDNHNYGGGTSGNRNNMSSFDDSASQYSIGNHSSDEILKITRVVTNEYGQDEEVVEVVKNPRVWKEYLKRKAKLDVEGMNVYDLKPTGDSEVDRKKISVQREELNRLERNKERRLARENAKAKKLAKERAAADPNQADSPAQTASPGPSGKVTGTTTRKCANCGQTGHIKTNKKYWDCPNSECFMLGMPVDEDQAES